MNVAVYCRVSTEDQRERQTIENQVETIVEFCEREGHTIREIYKDDGVTGTLLLQQRLQGQALLADAKAGKFQAVVVKQRDRLGRDALVVLEALQQLKVLGIDFVSVRDPVDPNTPFGKLSLVMSSGIAGYERDMIVQRSVEGTNRLARLGTWLGGIVPYGYRVEGQKRDARLVINDEPLPGIGLSEAEVIRLVYRMTAVERQTCVAISDRLNALAVPPRYVLDDRTATRGKRKHGTAGIWRPARVRNMIVNTTYMGQHVYGKRSTKVREVIVRDVPAIVPKSMWTEAQAVLHSHMMWSPRNAKRMYLLRGLIHCGICGLTYVGEVAGTGAKVRTYYACNGRHGFRGLYRNSSERCQAPRLSGELERLIWADVEEFLRNPGDVLIELQRDLQRAGDDAAHLGAELESARRALHGLDDQRQRVVGLYRRGVISEVDLDQQLAEIENERQLLGQQSRELEGRFLDEAAAADMVRNTDTLLTELRRRIDSSLSDGMKRQLVEFLVKEVRVDTLSRAETVLPQVTVTYRFPAIGICTDMGSLRRPA